MSKARVPGALLEYDDVGSGPPVLLLQGVGVACCGWGPQVDGLSASYRCISVDNRGIGGSEGELAHLSVAQMADDALALLDVLGIDRAHVVGHSLGGVIAQRIALTSPHRVLTLSLLCTFSGGKDLSVPSARLAWLGLRTRIGTRAMRRGAFAKLVSSPRRVRELGIAAVCAELEAAFGRSLADEPPVAGRQLKALRAHDERARLVELASIPTLVMAGAWDPIATPRIGRALATAIPGAVYRDWAEESHALPIQRASEVNGALINHFASVSASPS